VINRSSGAFFTSNYTVDDVQRWFAEYHVDAKVFQVAGSEIAEKTMSALKDQVDGIIVGGGDGTVGTVAGVLSDGPTPMGILPLGTLNHFAKDMGIPLTMEEAVSAIADLKTALVDVGEVNGEVFVNNSSIGGYPYTILSRDWQQRQLGRNKWLAMAISVFRFLKRFRVMDVHLILDGVEVSMRTPFVFIGNNDYELDRPPIGKRSALDSGRLCLYTSNCRNWSELIKLSWKLLRNRLEDAPEFMMYHVTEAWIHTRKKRLYVAMDGEVTRMKTPLHYRSREQSLQVYVPPTPPEA